MAQEDTTVELRGQCARQIVDVLDAVSQARRATRMELVNQILREWVDAKLAETELIRRVVGK
jgi:hypothetical protein